MSKKEKTPEEEEEFIIPPGAVDPKAKEEKPPALEEPANLETTEENSSEIKEDEKKGEEELPQPSREEIEETFALGKQLKDYQKSHPGWDPWLLERDYRSKTAELARLKETIPEKPEEKISEPDLSDVHPDDIAKIEKILKAKGFISKKELDEIDRRNKMDFYEKEKSAQVNGFLRKYPQYLPKNDPTNANWDSLMSEFGLYKLPQDPEKIGELLERAHRIILKVSISPKNAAELLAQNKTNNLGRSSLPGTNPKISSAVPRKSVRVTPEQARAHLKGWTDEEVAEMFGSS